VSAWFNRAHEKERIAQPYLSGLQPAVRVAQEMARLLGAGSLLFRALSPQQEIGRMKTGIAWLRSALRLDDQPLLTDAARECDALLVAVESSPGTRAGVHRRAFHAQCSADLDAALRAKGQRLYLMEEDPVVLLPELAATLDARTLFVNALPGSEESAQIDRLGQSLPRHCSLNLGRDNRLFDDVFGEDTLGRNAWPMSFSSFRRKVEKRLEPVLPVDTPEALPPPPDGVGAVEPLQSSKPVGLLAGGEHAGRERLVDYLFRRRLVTNYKQTRNGMLSDDDSTRFSPWLANGCLSARRIWSEVERFEVEVEANESTYWVRFELLWREYFRWLMDATGSALFRPSGLSDTAPTCRPDASRLQAWCEGRTGVPLIDAAMRELAETGYTSNRARQNAASFLVKDLQQDWREGAAWFEHQLVDYDTASNWGNWAYQAGTGTDTKDRWFNVVGQARRYDPQAEYLGRWLPELRGLEPAERFMPWKAKTPVADYPAPMVEDARWS